MERGEVRFGTARGLEGTFGWSRAGAARYRVRADSLSEFREQYRAARVDSSFVVPRLMVRARDRAGGWIRRIGPELVERV
jgi:hypothetical protein